MSWDEDGNKLSEIWYINGLKHREKEPALIEYRNGKKVKEEWYIKDNLHRKNGPAYITYYNSIIIKKYYKNGIHIPELDIYINKST